MRKGKPESRNGFVSKEGISSAGRVQKLQFITRPAPIRVARVAVRFFLPREPAFSRPNVASFLSPDKLGCRQMPRHRMRNMVHALSLHSISA
ncbi:hypothetical protein [Ruegeria marisrubri]|uniref:hypothetical protein n=1 Tax=Ruegeria marisrubri TaxID=1685379 RepID=UPI000A67B916|nr:hypothetical protein [Ruegeria marisrubri]